MTLNDLLGPFGLTVALVAAVGFLARELIRFIRDYIADLKGSIAAGQVQLAAAMKGWQEQTEANRVLADAQAARNRDDEMRHRIADAAKVDKV